MLRGFHSIILIFLLTSAAAAQTLIWSHQSAGGYVDSSPAIGDFDNDGVADIVVAATSGTVVALDISGRVIWEQNVRGPLTVPPTVVVGRSLANLVLVMNNAGQIIALEGASGRPIWEASLPESIEWGQTAIASADVDGDGSPEIVAGDRSGHVICLSEVGDTRWIYQGSHGWTSSPALGDINGDGHLEVLLGGTELPLVCLTSEGKELWRLADRAAGASPVVADLDGNGQPEIVCGIDSALTICTNTGKILSRTPMTRPIDSAITVADANQDSTLEVFAVDLAGILVCIDRSGQELWRADVLERARRSPTVGDVDGDGKMEVLVAGYSGRVHVFTAEGTLKTEIDLEAASNASATLVPDAMGKPLVVVPVVAGSVKVFQWDSATPNAALLWPQYRLNAERTASLVTSKREEQTVLEVDFGRLYTGMNEVVARVENAQGLPIKITATATIGDTEPVTVESSASDGLVELRLPYVIPSDRAVNVQLRCRVESDGKTLATREQHAYVAPFQRELADVRGAFSTLDDVLASLPNARDLQESAAFLRSSRETYTDQVSASGSADDLTRRALRDGLHTYIDELNRLVAIATTAKTCHETRSSSVLACAANPWAPFGGIDEIVEGRLNDGPLRACAFSGETESAAVNVFNFTSETKVYRITVEPLTLVETTSAIAPDGAVAVREVIDVPTDLLDRAADALPMLNEANLLQVPAWGARQVWITINTAGMAPGEWNGRLSFKSLDVQPDEAHAALNLTVWPSALPDEQALRLCHWGYVHSSVLKDIPEAALADQVSHGTDVFVGLFYPKATFNEHGDLTGPLDFTEHDAYVRQHAPHGIILFCGYQGALQGPGDIHSEAYAKAHVQWLRQWVAHLKELGVGYDGFALYPVDEPGLADGLVETYLRLAKLARDADPNIQMYTDPVGRISMAELKTMAPYVDIWCPNRNGFLLKQGNDMLDFIKSTGSQVWTYECEGNAKHQSPLGYYRGLAWLAWHHGLTGFGFWSYCTSPYDPWYRPGTTFDYLLIYQGKDVVPSKRWEAVRDGVEDYTMLAALGGAADRAHAEGRAPEAVAEARIVLGANATAIAQFCGLDNDGTLPGKAGAAGERRVADARWETIQSCRQHLASVLQSLTTTK